MRASPPFLTAVPLALLALVAASACGGEPDAVADPLLHRESGYVGSAACRACHEDQHASWAATHHSTMTQRPSAATVLGRFDGATVAQGTDSARPFRDGERFLMELRVGGVARTAEVELLVGSRRYQQYFERRTLRDGASFCRTSRASTRDIPVGRTWADWGAWRGFFCRAWKEFMLIAAMA